MTAFLALAKSLLSGMWRLPWQVWAAVALAAALWLAHHKGYEAGKEHEKAACMDRIQKAEDAARRASVLRQITLDAAAQATQSEATKRAETAKAEADSLRKALANAKSKQILPADCRFDAGRLRAINQALGY